MRIRPLLLLGSALASGCAVGPSYHAPAVDAPSAFVAATGTATGAPDLSHWWQQLQDPELNSLVERALRANPDLELALTRLQQVREQQAVWIGAALPSVEATGAAGNGTGSDLTRAGAAPALRQADNKGDLNQIREVGGFAASWELDLFGGTRRAIQAGRADVQAAAADRSAVLISVVADVARNYTELRGLQTRQLILQASIDSADQLRDFQQTRYDRGISNELDLQLATRETDRLHADLPLLQADIRAAQGRLAALLDVYPEQLSAELSTTGALPSLPGDVAAGVPLQLLQRRPDVRAAERQLAAATARIGVATAALFPHIALNAGVGVQSDQIGASGSHIWAFGPSAYWPLLDFGALDAQVNVAQLQAHAQLVNYKKTVVTAVEDADDAITGFHAQQQRLQQLNAAMSASERAVDLAQQRYERGLSDFLNVIDAQRQQYQLADEYTSAQQSAVDAYIGLCQALGGGWEQYQSVPAVPVPEPAVIASLHRLLAAGGAGRWPPAASP